jgi:hypothetical protein
MRSFCAIAEQEWLIRHFTRSDKYADPLPVSPQCNGRLWQNGASGAWGDGLAGFTGRMFRALLLSQWKRSTHMSIRIMSEAFSAIMIDGALVFELFRRGITELSQMRNPSMPRTRNCGSTTEPASPPMRQVPTGW